MSTPSLIGIANADDTITYIYCHFDGYVKGGIGESLLKNFNTLDTVNALLQGGDVSYHTRNKCNTIPNDDYKIGVSGSEFLYLFEPETATWIYKETLDSGMESDWKLLSEGLPNLIHEPKRSESYVKMCELLVEQQTKKG